MTIVVDRLRGSFVKGDQGPMMRAAVIELGASRAMACCFFEEMIDIYLGHGGRERTVNCGPLILALVEFMENCFTDITTAYF